MLSLICVIYITIIQLAVKANPIMGCRRHHVRKTSVWCFALKYVFKHAIYHLPILFTRVTTYDVRTTYDFPVLTNFVMCVYLNVFNSILFQWIFIISFNFSATLLWLFMRDVSKASWISRHRHLDTSSSIAKILFFPYETNLKKKVEYLCPIHLNIFLLISLGSLMHRSRGAAWDDIKILQTSQANSR